MNDILLLKCSPRPDGVTDRLAEYFGAALPPGRFKTIALRDKKIIPCQNCGLCQPPPHFCPLNDDCAAIFTAMSASRLALFASPIYFYALPAHFKALIDRCQSHWEDKTTPRQPLCALALLACGRKKGDKLFEGALRTLSWFLKPLNGTLCGHLEFRGLENCGDLAARADIPAAINAWAKNWLARIPPA